MGCTVMTEKKALVCLMAYLTAGMIAVGLWVYCIDPFYHYHEAWFELPTIMDNAVYQTAGAARNLPYDSVIVGTSMTENFHASWFNEEMGWNTLKLSYSGARTDDLKAILEQIYADGRGPCNVVMDVNEYQLTVPPDSAYTERPEYLYDQKVLTDASYLFNQDVLITSMDRIADKFAGKESNLDTAYTWEEEEYFGASRVLEIERKTRWETKWQIEVNGENAQALSLETCEGNINNIIPFIEAHPETTFYIFYPPYSMLYWERELMQDSLEEMMQICTYSVERLLGYGNVKIFYFQNEKEIIGDLDNYRDATHYKPIFNRYICECMKTGENLLTKENYKEELQDMYEYVLQFDYEALWASE